MTSSNEGLQLHPSPLRQELRHPGPRQYSSASSMSEDEDDDENSTAVGAPRPAEQCFTPQPNAFTHPPTSTNTRSQQQGTSYSTPTRPNVRSSTHRHSYSAQTQHTPYNMISPSHQADHDAALRASLSTLLSFAAPARSLPKKQSPQASSPAAQSNRVDTNTLRLVPESVALGGSPASAAAEPSTSTAPRSPQQDSRRPYLGDKNKRKSPVGPTPAGASNQRSSSKDRSRVTKKIRRASPEDEYVSPTLLTWVVSAGVVVLVSALSFSAGYVYGRETGRAEVAEMGRFVDAGASCGNESMRTSLGLRRLRLTGSAVRVS